MQLGHYEIIAPLGAGGMGQVYRARDPRLGREVAIKVLSPAAAADPGLLQRLEQEARTVAALNHPNLLAIYDIGTHEGAPFLVMELLQGETLRARLAPGSGAPLPLRRALDFARQIAQGLAAAHDAGIIHRDLKPENIFLTSDDRAKILDFGLAKTLAAPASAEAATLAGVASSATLPGMVLGTAGYMAPEQVRGEPATARSDIFAFGAVLYEMLTAQRAFGSGSSIEVMSAILRDEPPEAVSNGAPLSPALDRIVRRCLEKDPRRRFQSASDLGFALASLETVSTSSITPAPRHHVPSRSVTFRYVFPVAAFLIGAALAYAFFHRAPAPAFANLTFSPIAPEVAASTTAHWSPDGTAVAYAAPPAPGQPPQVFVRYLDSPTATQLTRIKDLDDLDGWSPAGDKVFYDDTRRIWSVAAVGGAPQLLYDFGPTRQIRALDHSGALWTSLRPGPDGRFGVQTTEALGAAWKPYTPAPFAASTIINIPELAIAPDHKQILLSLNSERGREELWLLPYPADPHHPPRQIFTHLPRQGSAPAFSWLPDSRHLVMAVQPNSNARHQLWLVDTQSAAVRPLTFGLGAYGSPAVSPSGASVLFVHPQGNFDIVSVRLSDALASPLVAQSTNDDAPAWALHAPSMVFTSDRTGTAEIWLRTLAANGDATDRPPDRPLVTPRDLGTAGSGGFLAPTLSPSADRVLFSAMMPATGKIKLLISSVAGGKPIPLTNDPLRVEAAAAWSPDGNNAVYLGIHGNQSDLMLAPTSGNAVPKPLRANISIMVPAWSPDGQWIAYQATDATIHLVSPDGKTDRNLGALPTNAVAFSSDSRLLYGIDSTPGHNYLFQVDLATKAQRRLGDIGADFTPITDSTPALRLTLTPDGKSLTYSTANLTQSLWQLRGLTP